MNILKQEQVPVKDLISYIADSKQKNIELLNQIKSNATYNFNWVSNHEANF